MNCPIANFGKQSLVYTCLFSGGQFFGLSLSYIEELSEPGQRWGLPPPSFFCRSATLFQPRGQIMPAALLLPPPDFHTFLRPCVQMFIDGYLGICVSQLGISNLFKWKTHAVLFLVGRLILPRNKCRISSYSFRPWIVSAHLCTLTFGLMYCDL